MPVEEINNRLNIPRSVASRAFLEIAANILEQAALRRVIKTWLVPGRRMTLPVNQLTITHAHCPALQLWPEPRDGQPLTNASQMATLNVMVRLWVSTSDPLDALDIYGMVERAVHPETVADGAALAHRLSQITHWQTVELSQPAVMTEVDAEGPIAVAEGSVAINYRLRGF